MRIRSAVTGITFLVCAAPAWAQGTPSKEVERLKALKAFCESLDDEQRKQTPECDGLDDPTYWQTLIERAEEEIPSRNRFLRWVHLDGPWAPMSTGTKVYGIVGVHVVVAQIGGRLFVFGPPGAMIVAQSNGQSWTVRPALTWGLGVYLRDFKVPGSKRKAQLFVNFARAWMSGTPQNGLDMIGISVTWKK
jgi:hypothetical protein